MKTVLLKLMGRASDLADTQPILALFLGGALLAVFLTALFRTDRRPEAVARPALFWTLYGSAARLTWALFLIVFLLAALAPLRTYIHQTVAHFQGSHGRVTQANYNAVQTIWGAEQEQGELKTEIFTDEEVTERIESEDLTKPAVLRKKTVRRVVTGNPFLSARHEVTLRQNPRRKGSAFYDGYETACRFSWKLKNPADTRQKCILTFPLPAAGAMYDRLFASLNGEDVLPKMELKDNTLVLTRELQPNEIMDLSIAFESRGMSFWYFQVKEAREIRDFMLTLNLPDLAQEHLNYPGGCMTPTEVKPTTDGAGCVLTFRLDHAISNQGMGIALPSLPQPGAITNAVLSEVEDGWLLGFVLIILGLTLASVNHAVLISILFNVATACAYGLVADFSDLLLGFWGTAALVLLPMFLFLAWLLRRVVSGTSGKMLGYLLLIFGIVYPCLAGLDSDRQTLYFNVCSLVFLAWAAWQLMRRSGGPTQQLQPTAFPWQPVPQPE